MNIQPLLDAINDRQVVSGLTHSIYRYPARFSPLFARAAIETFTEPGDTVLDPFMGGSTSLVEALSLGRNAIGTEAGFTEFRFDQGGKQLRREDFWRDVPNRKFYMCLGDAAKQTKEVLLLHRATS